jgi:phosphonate transport system substrate-binding protein
MTRLRQVGRRAVLAGLALPFISAAPDRGLLRIGLTPVLLDNDAALLDALAGYLGHRTGYRIDLQRRRTY